MKNILKYAMTMALPVLALASCTDKYEYDGVGKWDATDGYQQIYFEKSNATVELDPTDPTTTTFQVFRRNSTSAATVKLDVLKNTDNVFTVSDAVFAAGDSVATVTVSFPNAEVGTSYTLQVTTTDPSNVSNYSSDILYTMNLTRIKWNYLGVGNFAENFWYEDNWGVEIYQRDDNENIYRIKDPFGPICQAYIDAGYASSIDGTQSDYVVLTLLQPGDLVGGHEVENSDLVDFTDMSTGYHHSSYDATVKLYHPRRFTAAADNEDAWAWNKVLSYQADGKTPGQIQLAPRYYMDGVGGWNQSQADGQLIITFPGYTPPYNIKIDEDFDYSLVFEGIFASEKLDKTTDGIALYVGEKVDSIAEATGDAYERFAAESGTPYAIASPYARGYNLYFAVNEEGKIIIPEGYEAQPIGIEAVGEDVYAHINGGASTFTASVITLNITFQNVDGSVEYGTTNETLSNITWTQVGTGTYTYTVMFNDPMPDPGYVISKRDDDNVTYKVGDWFYGVDMTFTWDKKTNKCSVPEQFSGYIHSSYGNVYVADLANYAGDSGYYENYPCYYDPETSTFHFTVTYFISSGGRFGIGEETLQVEWDAAGNARVKSHSSKKSTFALANAGLIKNDKIKRANHFVGKKVQSKKAMIQDSEQLAF